MSRRERDQLRHELVVFADKVLNGEVPGFDPRPYDMPDDKYGALLDFIELEMFDLMAPVYDPTDVDIQGLTPEQAEQKLRTVEMDFRKARADLFAYFEGFSRAKTAGAFDNPKRRFAFVLALRLVGFLGDRISNWAEPFPVDIDITEVGPALPSGG